MITFLWIIVISFINYRIGYWMAKNETDIVNSIKEIGLLCKQMREYDYNDEEE
jgi:hypothetical protein